LRLREIVECFLPTEGKGKRKKRTDHGGRRLLDYPKVGFF